MSHRESFLEKTIILIDEARVDFINVKEKEEDTMFYVIQSWDPASDEESTQGITWCVTKDPETNESYIRVACPEDVRMPILYRGKRPI